MQPVAGVTVTVSLRGHLRHEVIGYLESEAGWHVVAGDGPVAPLFTIAAEVGADPCVVVLQSPVAGSELRDALVGGALDVIAWPEDRERLLTVPGRLGRAASTARPVPVLRIGACRGGVGATTVALAAGALVAWSGRRALVIGDEAVARLTGLGRWEGPGSVELAGLGAQAAEEVASVARPVPAVTGLSVLGGGAVDAPVAGWPYDVVVVDAGVGGRDTAPVLVGAADTSLATAPEGRAVVVVAHGPLDRRAARSCLGREPAAWLPYSSRVARAGSAGRVPSSLPGSWVHTLRQGLAAASRTQSPHP